MSPWSTTHQRYRRGCGIAELEKKIKKRKKLRNHQHQLKLPTKTVGVMKLEGGEVVPLDHNGAYPLAGWEIEGALHGSTPVLSPPAPLPRKPGVYVYNTRPAGTTTPTTPGHWVAVCVPLENDEPVEFFDSFGKPPSAYPDFSNCLNCESEVILYNPLQLQESGTFACGHYVIAYCAFQLVGLKTGSFLSLFNPLTPRVNDTVAVSLATPMVKRVRDL